MKILGCQDGHHPGRLRDNNRAETSHLFHPAQHTDPLRWWAQKLMETKPFKLVAVATANKLARIAFAVMRTGTSYRAAKPEALSAQQSATL